LEKRRHELIKFEKGKTAQGQFITPTKRVFRKFKTEYYNSAIRYPDYEELGSPV